MKLPLPELSAIGIAGTREFPNTRGMAKTLALLFRVVLVLIGILGFPPATAL